MKNIVKISSLFFLLLILISELIAEEIYTSGCSQEDIQAAIDAAAAGDTIHIPAGNASWTNRIEIRKEITLLGTGIGQTIIYKTENAMIYIAIYEEPFRISGFEFYGNDNSIALDIHGSPQNFRVDHCKFQNCRTRAIVFSQGYQYGVIDHNEFLNNGTSDIAVYGDNDNAWERQADLGGSDFVFIEEQNFNLEVHSIPIDIQGLASGMYFVQIKGNSEFYSEKFIKE